MPELGGGRIEAQQSDCELAAALEIRTRRRLER